MTRLIIGIALLLVCSYVGVQINRYYKQKNLIFSDLAELMKVIMTEIGFRKSKKSEIFGSYRFTSQELKALTEENYSSPYLNRAENNAIRMYFDGFGKYDLINETKNAEIFNAKAIGMLARSEKELKEKGKLYFQLCVLLGLALCIVII
ncbi:MAG: hypothetical protein ACI4S9_08445 [Christensenellales bacterium]